MSTQDYYAVLGVPRDATPDQIRKAFKKIARENHPDAKPDDTAAAERFKAAAEAYDVLGDPEKRKKYDQFGANWKHVREGQGPFPGADPFRRGGPVDIDLQDLFGGGAVDLGELFGGMFGGGGGRHRQSRPQRGNDVSTSIQIPFQMSATGGDFELTLQRGNKSERLTVKIPAGIENGQKVRLAGQGEPGTNGGPAGDLLVHVQVAQHPYFRREGDNVVIDVPVTITEAALGAKLDVPTLTEGTVTLTLPGGTSSGAKLRLKGKGFQNPKSGRHGDQFVVIKILAPKQLDDRARELLQEFAERHPQFPRNNLW